MKGFRCAGCGRALDELRACKYSHERFYCSEFCSEEDEAETPSLSIWDYPTSVGWIARMRAYAILPRRAKTRRARVKEVA